MRWSDDEPSGIQFDGLRARDVWALNKYFEQLPASRRRDRGRRVRGAVRATSASRSSISGPSDGRATVRGEPPAARRVAAALDACIGDGVEDALGGARRHRRERRSSPRRSPMRRARSARSTARRRSRAAQRAIAIAAARQAAGLAVPELPRAWAYVLLCADRGRRRDARWSAPAPAARARRTRRRGRRRDVWAKYPEVDAMLDRELVRDRDQGRGRRRRRSGSTSGASAPRR